MKNISFEKNRFGNNEYEAVSRVTEAVIYSFVKNGHRKLQNDLDDVKSLVATKVWNKLDSFDPSKASFNTWISTIAYNTICTVLRGYRRDKEHVAYAEDLVGPETGSGYESSGLFGYSGSADCDVISKEGSKEIYKAISAQGMDVDGCLQMIIDGFKYHEIAQEYGISTNYLGVKLCKARKNLLRNPSVKSLMNEYGMIR